jgi:hypothetical protein
MNQFEQALMNFLNCQYVRCRETQGMWLIEIVISNLTPAGRNTILASLPRTLQALQQPNLHIWKAFAYADDSSRYTAKGTLHSIPSTYENGIYSTTLSASDCYLDITEFDGELLQMRPPAGHIIYAQESVNSLGQPILPYQVGATHIWLEAMGGEYTLGTNAVHVTNSNHPYRMTVNLQ